MQDIENFDYLLFIKDNILLIYWETKKAIYKIVFNKNLKYISYINKIIRKFINNTLKQIYLLFERYL